MKRIISLGAGVQSSAMLLMAIEGRFGDIPDAAIFADTQAEPQVVYRWLDWLESQVAPFPVHRVSRGSLEATSLEIKQHSNKSGTGWMKSQIPAFLRMPDGRSGILGRSCTYDYKLRALYAKARSLAKVKRGERCVVVEQWIGISLDEAHRMKPSREPWAATRYPLVDARLTRLDCLEWMRSRGYPQPPRSACVFCPFHSDAEWLSLRDNEPEEFARAVRFDYALRETQLKVHNLTGVPYLHRSLKPLDRVAFKHDGQHDLDLWGNECEGMCGL